MKMDTDGHLYWAIKNADGTSSFLLDNNGQKVRASGTMVLFRSLGSMRQDTGRLIMGAVLSN